MLQNDDIDGADDTLLHRCLVSSSTVCKKKFYLNASHVENVGTLKSAIFRTPCCTDYVIFVCMITLAANAPNVLNGELCEISVTFQRPFSFLLSFHSPFKFSSIRLVSCSLHVQTLTLHALLKILALQKSSWGI